MTGTLLPGLRSFFSAGCFAVLLLGAGLSAGGETDRAADVARTAPVSPLSLPASQSTSTPLRLPEQFPAAMSFRATAGIGNGEFAKRLEESGPYAVIHGPGDERKCRLVRQRWPQKMARCISRSGRQCP